jgi:hypothetical protein
MARSRKRTRGIAALGPTYNEPSSKRGKITPCDDQKKTRSGIQHAVLSQFYGEVLTLRQYVLAKLPASSRVRRKKIAAIGSEGGAPNAGLSEVELSLQALLDNTLVGTSGPPKDEKDNRWDQWVSFSQRGDDSYVTLSDGVAGSIFCQSEVSGKVMRQRRVCKMGY